MGTVHERRFDAEGVIEDGGSRSFASLVNRLLNEILRLLDQKIALLKLEVREELRAVARTAGLLAAWSRGWARFC